MSEWRVQQHLVLGVAVLQSFAWRPVCVSEPSPRARRRHGNRGASGRPLPCSAHPPRMLVPVDAVQKVPHIDECYFCKVGLAASAPTRPAPGAALCGPPTQGYACAAMRCILQANVEHVGCSCMHSSPARHDAWQPPACRSACMHT